MNYFLDSPENRIIHWRNFRHSLNEYDSDYKQIEQLVKWFSFAPTTKPYIYWEEPQEWWSPWEIFHSGLMCQNSLAFLMERTLYYSDKKRWSADRLQLWWIKCHEKHDFCLILVIDDEYVLNYSYNEIVELDKIKDKINVKEIIPSSYIVDVFDN